LASSAFVFVLAQVSFLLKGKFGDPRYYVPTALGSVVLMIAGFYFSGLLRLKGAGIDREESSAESIRIPTPGTLDVSLSNGEGGNPPPCRGRTES
jgi:hypothetical protein